MKISQLITAFQKYTDSQEKRTVAADTAPPPASTAASKTEETVLSETRTTLTDDIVTVSPQAVFLFAASQFDPQRISRREVSELADTLRDGGAISERDRDILTSRPDADDFPGSSNIDFRESGDLIADFQGRLSNDLAKSNVNNVESDTRALSILGRLASIREELL